MQINGMQSNSYTSFYGKKHNNKQSEKEHNTIKHGSNTLRDLALLGASIAATLSLSACKPQEIPNETSSSIPPAYSEEYDSGINTNENYILDTRSDEEKFEAAKSCIESAIKDYAAIQDDIWKNFPEIFNATKNSDGKIKGGPTDGTFTPTTYIEKLDFAGFYSNDYPLMSSIASGEEKLWENVETTEEAVELVINLLDEATSNNGDFDGITSGQIINQGEYAILQMVLDELSNINDATKEVADVCKKGLQEAAKETKSVDAILARYDKYLDEESSYADGINTTGTARDTLIENASIVESGFKRVEALREKYEQIKADMESGEMPNSLISVKDAYTEYQTAFKNLVQEGGINSNNIFAAGGISDYHLNVGLIKHNLEELIGGRDDNE